MQDIYALGFILYSIWHGFAAYHNVDGQQYPEQMILERKRKDCSREENTSWNPWAKKTLILPAHPPLSIDEKVDQKWKELILWCWSFDRRHRPTAEELFLYVLIHLYPCQPLPIPAQCTCENLLAGNANGIAVHQDGCPANN